MKKSILLFAIFCFGLAGVFSQTGSINNVQVAQRTDGSGLVDVYFDLTGAEPNYFISMEVSFDTGNIFAPISPYFLSGAAGWTTPGNYKHAVWNGKSSFPETYSTQTQLKLTASAAMYAPCPGIPSFTDARDGQTYNTVQIGSQCWMKENLAYLPNVSPPNSNSDYWVYGYSGSNVAEAKATYNYQTYGVLYGWAAAYSACPSGWHLPSDNEWCTITKTIDPTVNCNSFGSWSGTNAGGKMKEAGTVHWLIPNTGATNESGFTGLPAGTRLYGGTFSELTYSGYFWSSTMDAYNVFLRFLKFSEAGVQRESTYYNHHIGYSVRCLKN